MIRFDKTPTSISYTITSYPNLPNDVISGFTMAQIETDMLKHKYGLSNYVNEVKSHKPSYISNRTIDIYMNYYL